MYGLSESSENKSHLPNLTKTLILQNTNVCTLMRTYLGVDFQPFTAFKSPDWLRSSLMYKLDSNPSATVYLDNNNNATFKDWGVGYSSDIFGIVKLKYCVDYNGALEKIAEDFGIDYYGRRTNIDELKLFKQDNSLIEFRKEYKEIKYRLRKFDYLDKKYWLSFGIPIQTLKKLNIFCADSLWINGELKYVYRPHDPAYIYIFKDEKIKVYFPYRKTTRFITNISGLSFLEGFDFLPKYGSKLVITKAYKDVAFIKSTEIESVSPCSESILVNKEIMDEVQSRFGIIYILFDNDEIGVKMSDKYKMTYPFLQQIFIPKNLSKDITDLSKKKGRKYATEMIGELTNI